MQPPQFHAISPTLRVWQNYNPAVKADLFSSSILAESGLYFVDPIPLSEDHLSTLTRSVPVAGIVVTNDNHQRSACAYADRFSAPVFARFDTWSGSKPRLLTKVTADSLIGGDLEIVEVDGAIAGEIALYHRADGGTLIVGDALINLDPYGFTFLPRKYCQNEKQMRISLRQLITKPAERMLFAHGTPILSGATARLWQLFETDR